MWHRSYEKLYMEESKKKAELKEIDNAKENPTIALVTPTEAKETKLPKVTSSTPEDLDAFLPGDLGSDDMMKLMLYGLESDDEKL